MRNSDRFARKLLQQIHYYHKHLACGVVSLGGGTRYPKGRDILFVPTSNSSNPPNFAAFEGTLEP